MSNVTQFPPIQRLEQEIQVLQRKVNAMALMLGRLMALVGDRPNIDGRSPVYDMITSVANTLPEDDEAGLFVVDQMEEATIRYQVELGYVVDDRDGMSDQPATG